MKIFRYFHVVDIHLYQMRLTKVYIIGCISGIDWTVLHENDDVRIILENGTEMQIRLSPSLRKICKARSTVPICWRVIVAIICAV